MCAQMSQRILVCSASNVLHMQVKLEHKPFNLLIHTRPQDKLVSGEYATTGYGRHPA